MNKIDKFINKHFDEIVRHYQEQAWELGYSRDEADGYAHDVIGFTFVGTKEEVNEELKNKYYHVICEEKDMLAVETFGGITYPFLEY